MHAHPQTYTHIHSNVQHTENHMHVDLFESEQKHQDGGVFRTWCLRIESKICLHGFRVY